MLTPGRRLLTLVDDAETRGVSPQEAHAVLPDLDRTQLASLLARMVAAERAYLAADGRYYSTAPF